MELSEAVIREIRRLGGTLTMLEERYKNKEVITPLGKRIVPFSVAQFLWGIRWKRSNFYYDGEFEAEFDDIELDTGYYNRAVIAWAYSTTQFFICIDLDSPDLSNPQVHYVDHDGSSRDDSSDEEQATLLDWLQDMDMTMESEEG